MTVPSETNRSGPYNGNGVTTVFSYGFRIVDEDHLRVIKTSSAGIETVLTIDADYIVSDVGDPAGGSIALMVAPLTGETITILRNVPLTQETDLENQGAYYAETVEDRFDLTVMQIQQVAEVVDRTIRVPAATDPGTDLQMPAPEAGKIIAWNETASGLQNLSPEQLASVIAYGTANADIFMGDGVTTVFNLSDNPAALNNLDVAIGGVTQLPGVDYQWLSGTTITFTPAPANGAVILVRYMQALAQGATEDDLVASDDGAGGSLWSNVKGFITYLRSSAGSSILGFVAAGVGAVWRSIQNKLRDEVSVKDFGAVGDGVANDTAAIVAAHASGRNIFYPAGRYNCASSVFSNCVGMKIRGAGREVAFIVITTSGDGWDFSACGWLTISGLSFIPAGAPQALANTTGLTFSDWTGNCTVQDCNFWGFSLDGHYQKGTVGQQQTGHRFIGCWALGNGRYNLHLEYSNDWTIDDNQFGSLDGIAFSTRGCYLDKSSAGTYTKNKHWSNGKALDMFQSHHNGIENNRFEMSDTENIVFTGCTNFNFVGNRIYSGSLLGNGLSDYMLLTASTDGVISANNFFSWDLTYGRWCLNIDTTSARVTLSNNRFGGFDPAVGPIRVAGTTTDIGGDMTIMGVASAQIASGTASYIGPNITTFTDTLALFQPGRRYAIINFYVAYDAAPGAGQSYTAVLKKNGVDTAMSVAGSGAAFFSGNIKTTNPTVTIGEYDFLSMLVTLSATAAACRPRWFATLVEY